MTGVQTCALPILCNGGQLGALTILNYKETKKDIERNFEKISKEIKENCLEILKSCYNQLNTPGWFINQETNAETDTIAYTRKDAKKAGFDIGGFNQFCATLIKK